MSAGEVRLRLARAADAPRIAVLSRELVEPGLGWSWRSARVLGAVRSPDDVVLVASLHRQVVGAAVMRFGCDEARLNLLLVVPTWQRSGVGRRLVEWLEASALTAGVSVVYLEVRADNAGAQAFYGRLGYRPVARLPGYYAGRESALRMARDLWLAVPADTA